MMDNLEEVLAANLGPELVLPENFDSEAFDFKDLEEFINNGPIRYPDSPPDSGSEPYSPPNGGAKPSADPHAAVVQGTVPACTITTAMPVYSCDDHQQQSLPPSYVPHGHIAQSSACNNLPASQPYQHLPQQPAVHPHPPPQSHQLVYAPYGVARNPYLPCQVDESGQMSGASEMTGQIPEPCSMTELAQLNARQLLASSSPQYVSSQQSKKKKVPTATLR